MLLHSINNIQPEQVAREQAAGWPARKQRQPAKAASQLERLEHAGPDSKLLQACGTGRARFTP